MAIRTKEFYERMNRIMDKLAIIHLSGKNYSYALVLFRKTFMFGKYEDRISREQMALATGMLEVNCSRAKRELEKGNIIYSNGKIQGFNLNIEKWEKVSRLIPFKKVSKLIQKGIHKAEKKGIHSDTYKETTKKLTKEGDLKSMKMKWKEIDKLEGKPWLRATMKAQGTFDISFIDEVLSKHTFTELYDCWLELQEAYKVRDKKAWFLAKLKRGPEEEE